MSAVLDYVRESILTAPDDLEHHALLPWARGEEPLPVSEYRVIDALVREWWERQTDAQVMLKELTLVDHRAGVRGAVACARWALEGYWTDADDRRPWRAVETAEAWLRGEATEECKLVAHTARLGADDDARSWAAADAALAASWAAVTAARAAHAAACAADNAPAVAAHAADAAAWRASDVAKAAAYAAYAAWHRARTEALRTLCDVVRAAVECPPAEVWLGQVRS